MRHPEGASALQLNAGWLIGSALIASGALIRKACRRELERFSTPLKKDQNLVTTGPYAVVRYPAYTGTLLASIGTYVCQSSPGTWMAESGWFETKIVPVLYGIWLVSYMMARTYAADKVLREQFPEEWHAWVKRTSYKMIPYVF